MSELQLNSPPVSLLELAEDAPEDTHAALRGFFAKRELLAVRIVERAAELPAPGTAPIRRIELVNA
jgi:hypothetical protein